MGRGGRGGQGGGRTRDERGGNEEIERRAGVRRSLKLEKGRNAWPGEFAKIKKKRRVTSLLLGETR